MDNPTKYFAIWNVGFLKDTVPANFNQIGDNFVSILGDILVPGLFKSITEPYPRQFPIGFWPNFDGFQFKFKSMKELTLTCIGLVFRSFFSPFQAHIQSIFSQILVHFGHLKVYYASHFFINSSGKSGHSYEFELQNQNVFSVHFQSISGQFSVLFRVFFLPANS